MAVSLSRGIHSAIAMRGERQAGIYAVARVIVTSGRMHGNVVYWAGGRRGHERRHPFHRLRECCGAEFEIDEAGEE